MTSKIIHMNSERCPEQSHDLDIKTFLDLVDYQSKEGSNKASETKTIVDLIPRTYLERFYQNSDKFKKVEYPLILRGRCQYMYLNNVINVSPLEKIELKINYIKRIRARLRFLRIVMKNLHPLLYSDVQNVIMSYITFENPSDLFQVCNIPRIDCYNYC